MCHKRPLLRQVGIRARKKEGRKRTIDLMYVRKTEIIGQGVCTVCVEEGINEV